MTRTRLRLLAMLLGISLGSLVLTHLGLGSLASWLETSHGAYLWSQEEYLQLLHAENYVGRGEGRILIAGASEARETFLVERFDERLVGWSAYQNATSWGTLEDLLLVLGYIEGAYGQSAIPNAIVVGISARFVGSLLRQDSPLQTAINLFAARYRVIEAKKGRRPRLAPKRWSQSLVSRLRFLGHQSERYRRAMPALLSVIAQNAEMDFAAIQHLERFFWPAKYHHVPHWSDAAKRRAFTRSWSLYRYVHAWDPARDRRRVHADLRALAAFTRKHGVRLFLVNIAEFSLTREGYPSGAYAAYLDIVRGALPGVPLLDLREALSDDEFHDHCHPVRSAALRLTDRVIDFISPSLGSAL